MNKYLPFFTNTIAAFLITTLLITLVFEIGNANSVHETTSAPKTNDSVSSVFKNETLDPTQTTILNGQHLVELSINNEQANSPEVGSLSKPAELLANISLILDDGQAENNIGSNDGSDHAFQFIWLNRFTPSPSSFPFYLDEIQILFSDNSLTSGLPIDLVVYEDTDGSSPDNSTWLTTHQSTIQTVDGSTWSVYQLNPPVQLDGPGDVLVGAINRYVNSGVDPLSYPAALDETTSQNRSWIGWWSSDPPQPPIMPPNNFFQTIDNAGFPGNWMIRAYGETLISAPDLVAPTNGATLSDNTPQFDWTAVNGATQYRLQVDNDSNFSTPEINITTTNLSYIPPAGLADGNYHWRVQARDGSGIWGVWSSPTKSFTIETEKVVYLPILLKLHAEIFDGPWEVEPNNSINQANGLIHSSRDYFGYPDEKDYFSFYRNEPGSITIDLLDHNGDEVQLQLFFQDTSNLVDIRTKEPYHIELSDQPPGIYYIYIFTKSGHNQLNNYTLKASFP